jgi:hypothetical protein
MQFCIRNLKQPNVMKFNFLKKTNTILKNYEGVPSYQLSPEMNYIVLRCRACFMTVSTKKLKTD